MAELATIATVVSTGSSILSGLGQMQAGRAANANAKFQAAQLEQQAGQERASAQRLAVAERRRSAIMQSNAQAAAAASGGSATDTTVLNLIGDIAKEGEFNALSALFEGEERARGLQLQSATARMEGKRTQKQGMFSGISTIVGGVTSAASKYQPSFSSQRLYTGYEYSKNKLPWQAAGNIKPSYMY